MPTPPTTESTAVLCITSTAVLFIGSLRYYKDLLTALQFTVRVMVTMIIIMLIASVILAIMTAQALMSH
mgnify:CR=1 FL=1